MKKGANLPIRIQQDLLDWVKENADKEGMSNGEYVRYVLTKERDRERENQKNTPNK